MRPALDPVSNHRPKILGLGDLDEFYLKEEYAQRRTLRDGIYLMESARWNLPMESARGNLLDGICSMESARGNLLEGICSMESARWNLLEGICSMESARWNLLDGI